MFGMIVQKGIDSDDDISPEGDNRFLTEPIYLAVSIILHSRQPFSRRRFA